MTKYAVHALLGVVDGRTEEGSVEADDLDELLARVREILTHRPDFRAVTVLHVEDLPLTLQGATEVDR